MKPGFTQAPAYVLEAIAAYNLPPYTVMPPQKGYRNQSFGINVQNGETLNFILYKNEPNILDRIRRTNNVANFAARSGMSARATFSNQIAVLKGRNEVRYGALYSYLPGKTILWEAYTKKHVKLLGATLSDLHKTLQPYPKANALPSIAQEYATIFNRMEQYFAAPAQQQAMAQKLSLSISVAKLNLFASFIAACEALPNQQALHMDFVRSNILFETEPELRISGILDFEKTGKGHPMFDIARTLAFLMVDCKNKPVNKVAQYFLDSGYNKRGSCNVRKTSVAFRNQKYDLLETLLSAFLLHDFYKFLRHNPYESLHQNQHFMRTQNILLEKALLKQL